MRTGLHIVHFQYIALALMRKLAISSRYMSDKAILATSNSSITVKMLHSLRPYSHFLAVSLDFTEIC